MDNDINGITNESLILTTDDTRIIGQLQMLALFKGLVRVRIYYVLLFGTLTLIEPLGMTVDAAGKLLSVVLIAYLELWPERDNLKHPARSEIGYIWKMVDNGWTPLFKQPAVKESCIGFARGDETVLWNFERFVHVNTGGDD